jgi:ABC-type phosphate/phosphonate transport system substrate-binding protein
VQHIAGLPMYDFPPIRDVHDTLWTAISGHLIEAGVAETPSHLTRDLGHFELWKHPLLLLGQGCEYPLAESFAGCIRLIATPRYTAPGCEGATYRSAIVVRERDPAARLSDLRNRRCVINEATSNSGMNLLRAAIAPLANGTRFFASVVVSGAHRRSVEMVSAGEADVAAVDCVSLAHLRRLHSSALANLRILDWTPSTPSLPFITAAATSDTTLQALRSSLAAVLADRSLGYVREQLFLDGVDLEPADGFSEVLRLKRTAIEQRYPVIS